MARHAASGDPVAKLLSENEIRDRLTTVPDWSRDGRTIRRRFELADFKAAMDLANRIADRAEAANHHPDIAIAWNKVSLALTTHSAGGLTDLDFRLAAEIDALT